MGGGTIRRNTNNSQLIISAGTFFYEKSKISASGKEESINNGY